MTDSIELSFLRPILLSAENFTPRTRTPWGGKKIADHYKAGLSPSGRGRVVGESWEFSCDRQFPSRIQGGDYTLGELFERFASEIVGEDSTSGCELLVKLIDTADELSLQLHPDDQFAGLKEGQCGKPESWLIVDSQPGCGIYLGFRRGMSRGELQKYLTGESPLTREDLHFVPVKKYDYFDIAPATPHAIGAGVTLIEPQRTGREKSGVTYRMWDWSRKYNEAGEIDLEHGSPRELHVDECLAICDPSVSGRELELRARKDPDVQVLDRLGTTIRSYPSTDDYQTSILTLVAGSSITVSNERGWGGLIMLEGEISYTAVGAGASSEGKISILGGQSALLPKGCIPGVLSVEKASECVFISPRGMEFSFLSNDVES